MAKRELSSTIRNLKFMQRGAQREEQAKKEEEEVVIPDGNFVSPSTVIKKCVVIMDGDPHPGATRGRMSFQSFNPSIDKLNGGEATNQEDSATCSDNEGRRTSSRENGAPMDEERPGPNSDLKRKQPEVASNMPEKEYPNKSPKNGQRDELSSSSPHSSKSSFKKPNGDNKVDWGVLRPPKSQSGKKKRG